MVKDHSDSERRHPLPPHKLLFPISSKVLLYASSHKQNNTYHGLCYTSRGALAATRNSSMGPPHEGSIRRPIAPRANALTTELHLAPTTMDSRFKDKDFRNGETTMEERRTQNILFTGIWRQTYGKGPLR